MGIGDINKSPLQAKARHRGGREGGPRLVGRLSNAKHRNDTSGIDDALHQSP
jgi:hypothetical protein